MPVNEVSSPQKIQIANYQKKESGANTDATTSPAVVMDDKSDDQDVEERKDVEMNYDNISQEKIQVNSSVAINGNTSKHKTSRGQSFIKRQQEKKSALKTSSKKTVSKKTSELDLFKRNKLDIDKQDSLQTHVNPIEEQPMPYEKSMTTKKKKSKESTK